MDWQENLRNDFGVDSRGIELFELLLRLLVERSDRNLTAVTSPLKIVDFHFRDSLSLLSFPELTGASNAVDVGSGAGFPGLPLAICMPGLNVSLLESNRQKSDFIQIFIDLSGLANASVIPLRAESAGSGSCRDHYDLALARAVGPLPTTMEYASPLVREGGSVLLQRGEVLAGERDAAESAGSALALKLARVEPVKPYASARNLHVWVFKKVSATPSRFPRKPGMARKRPLGG
ncbi:MAG: 16S rRNA (guanine(527)-N(7))-methyltransferase RsmG [Gaiellales bacterium]|nr:MAG: 16S rRNA (guanine(527)-N(7))-methyltransferase RsmG [Gaiellales bacterium]